MKSEKIPFDVVFSRKHSRDLHTEIVWAYTESRAREYLELAFDDFEEIISIDRQPEHSKRALS
jgi:hypothetical protein